MAMWTRDELRKIEYRRHGGRYADPMVAALARASTIKLAPRPTPPANA